MSSLVRTYRVAIAALFFSAALPSRVFASETDFEGTWNVVAPGHQITKLVIAGSTDGSGAMTVHAYGKCPPAPCDLGTVALTGLNSVTSHGGAPVPDGVGTATFTMGNVATIKVSDFKAVGMTDYITVQTTGSFGEKFGRLPSTVTDSFSKESVMRLPHPLLTPTPAPIVRPTGISLPTTSPK